MEEIQILSTTEHAEHVAAILGAAFVVCLFLYLRYRNRKDSQATLRTAMEKGVEVTPDLLTSLGLGRTTARVDLRRGVLCIGVAVGFVLFGLVRGPELLERLGAGAALLGALGTTFLGLWWFSDGRQR